MNIYNLGSRSVNFYLLDSGTHRLLIDCGYPGMLNDIGRAMRQTGFKIQEIDHLFVTHFHIDHAGAVQELKNAGVKFVFIDPQAAYVQAMETMMAGKWKYSSLMMEDNLQITADDSISFLKKMNIDGQVINTPGHSPDCISLVLDTGEAFTGDLYPEHLTEPSSEEYLSWLKLRSAGAKKIYPGHAAVYEIRTK